MSDLSSADFRYNRRGLLFASAAVAAAPSLAMAADDRPVMTTKAGKVAGRNVDGVKVFQGIHYGADTTGSRFAAPKPAPAWTGVRDAMDFGNISPQLGSERPKAYASFLNPRPESENCLVLNVYTAGLNDGKKRPVMVWFHGGGFASGHAASRYADGTRLAGRHDVVVVSVNHRLNAFGYLYLADLGGPELADSGNVGSLDMVLALKWVHDNAAAFGGDANNVTIFGQSGGGQKVSTLMAMPSAAGLFHRAVVQSGCYLRAAERDEAKAETRKVLAALNLQPSEVAKLRTMPAADLIAGLMKSRARLQPVVDGRSLPRHPFDPDAPPISKSVPLLIGTNRTESADMGNDETLFQLTWDDLPGRLAQNLKNYDTTKLVPELRRLNPKADPSEIYFFAITEPRFRGVSMMQADRKFAQGGAPVFMYLTAWETPVEGGRYHSPHGVELPFVFDTVGNSASMVGSGPDQQKMADTMSGAWTRFARTGNPGWTPYTPTDRAVMVFNSESKVVNDPMRGERLLLDSPVRT